MKLEAFHAIQKTEAAEKQREHATVRAQAAQQQAEQQRQRASLVMQQQQQAAALQQQAQQQQMMQDAAAGRTNQNQPGTSRLGSWTNVNPAGHVAGTVPVVQQQQQQPRQQPQQQPQYRSSVSVLENLPAPAHDNTRYRRPLSNPVSATATQPSWQVGANGTATHPAPQPQYQGGSIINASSAAGGPAGVAGTASNILGAAAMGRVGSGGWLANPMQQEGPAAGSNALVVGAAPAAVAAVAAQTVDLTAEEDTATQVTPASVVGAQPTYMAVIQQQVRFCYLLRATCCLLLSKRSTWPRR